MKLYIVGSIVFVVAVLLMPMNVALARCMFGTTDNSDYYTFREACESADGVWTDDAPTGNQGTTPTGGQGVAPTGNQEPARPTIDPSYADLINPLTGKADKGDPYALFTTVVANLIQAILGLSGAFAMLGFVWGGVTWMTSYGNDQKITRGRQMMVWSGFGLIVLLSSYAVVSYLFGALGFV